jgi:hypothetical protein
MSIKTLTRALLATASALLAISIFSSAYAATGPSGVTTTVTAIGKKDTTPPAINKDDVQLFQGKERMQVADWKRGETLYLAILIDDSLDSNVASQWPDLKAFIAGQPATTSIAVGYSRNGTIEVGQDFTTDHDLAAKALRIPLGAGGAFSSPYLSLIDWMKRWPSTGDRRSILFITSGIDYFRGGGFGSRSPDLDSTISRAQKENINIWTVYAPDAGHSGRFYFRVSNAQSNLSELSEQTGAESYYLGFGAPVSLKPYFDEISNHLSNQYLLTFVRSGGKKGKFERIHVTSEVKNVEFMAPSEVFVPAGQ